MKNTIKYSLFLFGCALGTTLFTGCQTIEGAGEDIETAGDAISGAARDASN